MKKFLILISLISFFTNAQHVVNGTITPSLKSDWIILYKIEGAKQVYIKDTKIKVDSIKIDNKKQTIGSFSFAFPENAKAGTYRVTYRLKEAGFVDFIYNKENVSFTFHPDYPNQTISFSESKENKMYKQYLDEISKQQQRLDSIQITALQNPKLNLNAAYKATLKIIKETQKKYLLSSKNMYVLPFIKASLRANPSEIKTLPKDYMTNMVATFFDNMNFSNKTLINSSFLIDRITDYIFYINFSDDAKKQQPLFKKSIATVLSKITDISFKKDVIELLVAQFESLKNLEIIEYLLKNHYKTLPKNIQDKAFLKEKTTLFATEIGKIAPNFSWTENNKTMQLATLNSAENYVLIFWSTDCSHCLREVPEVHKFLKENKKIKVIAFAIENNAIGWQKQKQSLPNWHHVLGLQKWNNKTARTYNINETPTYFILDKAKKIIAKPNLLEDVKTFVNKL